MIAQGKRSAALGYGREMIPSFFPAGYACLARITGREKRAWLGWLFTQGGGLGGLAPGYYLAAPSGRRKGEPACQWRRRDKRSVMCRMALSRAPHHGLIRTKTRLNEIGP
jgi:hypothetical protein